MKIAAVIAEYNPFHNGHEFLLKTIRNEYGYDCVIILQSGDFVQRGECALLDKYTRAQMAIKGGADLVLEFPTLFATGSAEFFAEGAVSILHGLGCVDALFFGAESTDSGLFQLAADILLKEPEDYREALSLQLKKGVSIAAARSSALISYLNTHPEFAKSQTKCISSLPIEVAASSSIESIPSSPNNILALEYYKAAAKYDCKFRLIPIQRMGSEYHGIGGAEDIRKSLLEVYSECCGRNSYPDCADKLLNLTAALPMPEASISLMQKSIEQHRICFMSSYTSLMHYALREHRDHLTDYLDVSGDLSNLILNQINEYTDYHSFLQSIKRKNMTYTRLSRALLHILLGIDAAYAAKVKNEPGERYARILAFAAGAQEGLLSTIKKSATIPLIAKPSDYQRVCSEISTKLFELDLRSADLYEGQLSIQNKVPLRPDIAISPLIV